MEGYLTMVGSGHGTRSRLPGGGPHPYGHFHTDPNGYTRLYPHIHPSSRSYPYSGISFSNHPHAYAVACLNANTCVTADRDLQS